MAWVDASRSAVWRAHRAMFVLWLVVWAVVAAMLLVGVTSGFSRPFYGLLALATLLQILHDWLVGRLSKRPTSAHGPSS